MAKKKESGENPDGKQMVEVGIEATETLILREKILISAQKLSDELAGWAKKARLSYGEEDEDKWWTEDSPPETYTSRLYVSQRGLQVQETIAHPEYHDGSNWVGWKKPFGGHAHATGMVEYRGVLPGEMEKVPEFIRGYISVLKEKRRKFKEICERVQRISDAIEKNGG